MSDSERLRRQLQAALKGSFRGRQHLGHSARMLFSTDASLFQVEPLAALVPQDAEDLQTALRLARDLAIGVHPRGAATGLAGESLGPGIVIDCHPGLRHIGPIDVEQRRVRVGAGVTLAELNAATAPYGLMFGPDPSSGTRATFGGMVGTNATGAHSLDYGYTGDHLLSAELIGADGERQTLASGPLSDQPERWRALAKRVEAHRETIEAAYPAQPRNRAGYNLKNLWDGQQLHPLNLLCGSEGTLGIVTELTLNLVPRPAHASLLMVLYDDLQAAAAGVAELMAFKPSALELIDYHIIEMGRKHVHRLSELLPGTARAVLLAEWTGSSEEAARDAMSPALQALGRPGNAVSEWREAHEPRDKATLWLIRREAEALVMNQPGRERALSFVEDTAVPYDRLPEWVAIKTRLFAQHGLRWATFGHAGAGELHTKVFIDPFKVGDYKRLDALARDLYPEAIRLGGTISGEHGDGLLRGPYLGLQYPELLPLFGEVKHLLDPAGLFNPGRKTTDFHEHPAMKFSRLGRRKPDSRIIPALFEDPDSLARESAACHGCGACRSHQPELRMCPLFRATGDELATPRAIGNLARLSLYGPLDISDRLDDTAREVAGYCFNCKLCRLECPSHVDIPALAQELTIANTRRFGASVAGRFFAELDRRAGRLGPLAAFLNLGMGIPATRRSAERLFGLTPGLPTLPFERGSFFIKAQSIREDEDGEPLVYVPDTHVLAQNHALGLAVLRHLRGAGNRVSVYTRAGVGLPALSHGLVDALIPRIRLMATELQSLCGRDARLVFSEPSAALMVRDEWPRLVPETAVQSLAERVVDATDFLAQQPQHEMSHPQNSAAGQTAERPLKVAYHVPCHVKALGLDEPARRLWKDHPGLEIETLAAGCCGMAGTFGMVAQNDALAKAVGKPLAQAIAHSAPDALMTECSACALAIRRLVPQLPVVHPFMLSELLPNEADRDNRTQQR